MITGRVYITAKTAQTFDGEDESDIRRKALELFRKDVANRDIEHLGSWVTVEIRGRIKGENK